MATYDKLINLSLLSEFLTKAKTLFATKATATQSADGLMSASDKIKIDALNYTVVYTDD